MNLLRKVESTPSSSAKAGFLRRDGKLSKAIRKCLPSRKSSESASLQVLSDSHQRRNSDSHLSCHNDEDAIQVYVEEPDSPKRERKTGRVSVLIPPTPDPNNYISPGVRLKRSLSRKKRICSDESIPNLESLEVQRILVSFSPRKLASQ